MSWPARRGSAENRRTRPRDRVTTTSTQALVRALSAIASPTSISSCPSANVGIAWRGGRPARGDVGVDGHEQGAERVGEALDVAAGQRAPPVRRGRSCSAGLRSRSSLAGRGGRSTAGRAARESQATAAVRAVDLVAAGCSCGRGSAGRRRTAPRAPFSKRSRTVATSSVRMSHRDRVAPRARSRTSRPDPVGLVADRDERGQVGHDRLDAPAGQERRQVEPVGADVADGAEGAAALRLEPPVPVGVEQQPVLEVVAGDQADVADPAVARRARARAG